MKNTKKFLSLLIVMVMLFAALPFASVSAADEYTLTLNAPCEVKTDGFSPATIYFTPEEDGVYHFYSAGSYNTSATLYDSDDNILEDNNDGKYGRNFGMSAYLTKGNTYRLQVWTTYEENMVTFPVVVEKPEALTYPVEIPYDEYQFVTFTPEKDGFYYIYSVGDADTYASIYDNEGCYITENDNFITSNFGLNCYLYEGLEYNITFGAYSDTDVNTIICIQDGVVADEAVIITPPSYPKVIDGLEEETYSCEGTVIEFTMSDGSKYQWSYDEGGLVNGSEVVTYVSYDYAGSFCIGYACEFCDAVFPYKEIENPVESIEYVGEPIIVYENTNGNIGKDYDGNEVFLYRFSLPNEPCIRINYKDGTNEVASFRNNNLPYFLSCNNNQRVIPWKTGTDNSLPATYLGHEAAVVVHVLETPVESIDVISEPDHIYTFGNLKDGYFNNDRTVYTFYPSNLSGLELFVTYKDGTTETVTGDDILNGYPYAYEVLKTETSTTGICKGNYTYKGFHFQTNVTVAEAAPDNNTGLIGDANCDNDINIKDATLIQKHTASITLIPNTAINCADVDRNGDINIKDATAIQKFIAGIDVNLPIGSKK